MSKMTEEKINCDCGNTFTIIIYDSVNVTVDPELKTKILNDEINTKVCDKCGKSYKIVSPVLYHDMDLRLMVWILPEQWKTRKDIEELKNRYIKVLEGETTLLSKAYSTGCVYAIVFGINELKEKLNQFEFLRTKKKI